MTDADIEASKAPLMDHLIELRGRLIKSIIVFVLMFIVFFWFSKEIYNILVEPYGRVAGPEAKLIYTAPQEYFFTEMKVAMFAAAFFSCPVIFYQIYQFVAPGLYNKERQAFWPYLIATPVFFCFGTLMVYYVVMPNLLTFFIGMQVAKEPGRTQIELLPRVSEYLSLIMTLIFAFGITFQMPVILTLLGNVGIISSQFLIAQWRYATVIVVAIAGLLTPPDLFSMLALAIPAMGLYGLSIFSVRYLEQRRAKLAAAEKVAEALKNE